MVCRSVCLIVGFLRAYVKDRDSNPVQKSGPHSPDTLDGLPQAEAQDGAHLVPGMTRHKKAKVSDPRSHFPVLVPPLTYYFNAYLFNMSQTNGHTVRNVQDHGRVKRGARMPDYKTTDIEKGPSSTSIAGPTNTETPSAAS